MTDLPIEKMRSLVDALFARTREKKIKWKPAFSDDAVEAKFGNLGIRLHNRYDPDADDHYVEILVLNKYGVQVDNILPATLAPAQTPFNEFPLYWQLMDQLYALASRQAHGADQAIDDILGALLAEDAGQEEDF